MTSEWSQSTIINISITLYFTKPAVITSNDVLLWLHFLLPQCHAVIAAMIAVSIPALLPACEQKGRDMFGQFHACIVA